jgi:hypothetical protein
MMCVVEMGSSAMIYTPNFIKVGFRHSKVDGGIQRHADSMMIS